MSVHAEDSDEAARIRQIFSEEKAEHITTGSEVSVPATDNCRRRQPPAVCSSDIDVLPRAG
jgi:hypothetical protein